MCHQYINVIYHLFFALLMPERRMKKLRGALDEKSFKRFLLGHQKISKVAIEELGS